MVRATAHPLTLRWMNAHGGAASERRALEAEVRGRRYPSVVGHAWPAMLRVFEHLGPPAFLGRRARMSALDEADFDALEHAVQHHDSRLVRMAYMMARVPMLERRWVDPGPGVAAAHPLEALEDQIRLGRSHHHREFDVVVIGSGAGGAPLAWSLARRGIRVAIVESGSLVKPTTATDALERYYIQQGIVGSLAGGGTTLVLAGKAVGGTTVINSGTSLRPESVRLEEWDALAGTSFGDGALEPWLDEVDAHMGVSPTPLERMDASARAIMKGLQAMGREGYFPLSRNAPDCVGTGRCCFGCPTGAKQSTDRAYLPGAIEAGAVLYSETTADAIVPRPGGADVFVRGGSGRRRLRAREVVISAGAIGTPWLLRSNRLGERWREAGNGLCIHPATKAFGMMSEPLVHGGVPQALGYRAPELPRLMFEGAHTPPPVTAAVLPPAGQRHRWWMERHDRLANYGLMVRDRQSGRVRGRPGSLRIRYGLHPDDARDLGAGLILCAEALFAGGAERVTLPLAGMQTEFTSVNEVRTLRPAAFRAANLLTSGFHPHATAAIGRVVDTDLGVIGCPHVHVADASVMPSSPGVNPQVTIMALALRLADHLAERF